MVIAVVTGNSLISGAEAIQLCSFLTLGSEAYSGQRVLTYSSALSGSNFTLWGPLRM